MPRRASGTVIERDGRFFGRVTLDGDKRPLYELPTRKTREQAVIRSRMAPVRAVV